MDILIPHNTTAQRTGRTPPQRALVYDTDLDKLFAGDGSTAGGVALAGTGGDGDYSPGSGLGDRSIEGKLQETRSITDFGTIDLSGTTECTTIIQAAIDAVAAIPRGGSIHFPDGIYKISNLVLKSHVQLIGRQGLGLPQYHAGAFVSPMPIFQATAGATGWMIDTPATDIRSPGIEGIALIGNAVSAASPGDLGGIRLRVVGRSLIKSCGFALLAHQAVQILEGRGNKIVDPMAVNCLISRDRPGRAGVIEIHSDDNWLVGGELNPSTATSGVLSLLNAGDTETGTAQAGAAGSITLAAATVGSDGQFVDWLCELTGGTGAGQIRRLSGSTASTQVATVAQNWETAPSSDSTYALRPILCYAAMIEGAVNVVTGVPVLELADAGLFVGGVGGHKIKVRCDLNYGPGAVIEATAELDLHCHANGVHADDTYDNALFLINANGGARIWSTNNLGSVRHRHGMNFVGAGSDGNKWTVSLGGTCYGHRQQGIKVHSWTGPAVDLPTSAPAKYFANADTTPSIDAYTMFRTNNSGATSVTGFDSGFPGQQFKVIGGDANTTFVHGGNIFLTGAANKTLAANEIISFAMVTPAVAVQI